MPRDSDLNWRDADAETTRATTIAELVKALGDTGCALDIIIQGRLDEPDEPCNALELCGHDLCNECGCLKDKRGRARAALAKAKQP